MNNVNVSCTVAGVVSKIVTKSGIAGTKNCSEKADVPVSANNNAKVCR